MANEEMRDDNARIQQMLREITAKLSKSEKLAERIVAIEVTLNHVDKSLTVLGKVIHHGNGQPSLSQRLTNIETVVYQHTEDIGEVKTHANAIIAAKALSKAQVAAGLIGMVVTALLSAIALWSSLLK